ncbi:MAG: ArsA-related P-loop ATPase, partial [Acidimicrobiia bacterium]
MSETNVVVVTGAGGVGKTTLSAALAIAVASRTTRTLVMTVDPAKRLADALDLTNLGGDPVPVIGAPGVWAAMLDATASWEAIVHRYSPSVVAPDLGCSPRQNELLAQRDVKIMQP